MSEWGIIVAIIGAVAAPVGAYFLAARKMSGRIDTSAASELWAESRSIREDYYKRLVLADKRVDELEAQMMVLEEQIRGLMARIRDLRALLRQHNITPPNGNNNESTGG